MTFTEFENIVHNERKDIFSVSQKSKTQDGGVLVTFKPGGKAYIYKGSYQQILSKLGIDKMGKHEKAEALLNLQSLLDYYKQHNGKKSIFTGKMADYAAEIADTERKIKALEAK